MALSRLNDGDAIDKDLVNKLIDQLNKLESANNFNAVYDFAGTLSTKGDTLLLQAGWQSVAPPGISRATAHIRYPVPLTNHGMIVVAAHAPGDITAAYIATVTVADYNGFQCSIERKDGTALKAPISFHWHCLGPVNPSSIV